MTNPIPVFTTGTTITSEWLNFVNANLNEATSVKDFGAVGDGVTDDWAAIKAAVDAINLTGGTLYFPPGHYYTTYKDHSILSNWIEITKSGVSFNASPGSVTIENFLFYVHGSYGAPIGIGSAGATRGDRNIPFASAHNLSVGDVIQIFSSVNAGSTDAGYYQMESTNPTTLQAGQLRLSEIHEVGKIISSTEVSIDGRLVYPNYKNNIVGYSNPLPDVTTAEIRKLNVVRGISFQGIKFRTVTANNFRSILARAVVDISFDNCFFEAGSLPGQHFKCTDVKGVRITNCASRRYPENITGSSWNSFLLSGGTCNTYISNCRFEGESQVIDFTVGLLSTDPGGAETLAGAKCGQISNQHMIVSNCQFIRCNNGATTHPGCYDVLVNDNIAIGCDTGFNLRSLKTMIANNILEASDYGVAISAFYHDLTISGNRITRMPIASIWSGITISPLSGETMNRNNVQRVLIKGNYIYDELKTQRGISIRNDGNGVPSNPSFTEFTDSIKTALSDYTIEDNHLDGCPIWIGAFINGVNIKNNTFRGGSSFSPDKYILLTNQSAKCYVDGNVFLDDLGGLLVSTLNTTLTYSYDNRHTLGQNTQSSSSSSKNSVVKTSLVPFYSISSEDGSVAKTGNYAGTNWTPSVFTNAGGVVTSANPLPARYIKAGNVITIVGRIQLVTNAGGNGEIQMELPTTTVAGTIINGVMVENANGLTSEIVQSSAGRALLRINNAPSASTYSFGYVLSYEVQ